MLNLRDELDGEKNKYFESALSDFIHNAATGDAIRHMTDKGYTLKQILAELQFPTPLERVRKAYMERLMANGIIRDRLDADMEGMSNITMHYQNENDLYKALRVMLDRNGSCGAYMSCPFGMIRRDRQERLAKMLAPLTERERDYILGIPWEMKEMYHVLNMRMLGIGSFIDADVKFIFLGSGDIVRNDRTAGIKK